MLRKNVIENAEKGREMKDIFCCINYHLMVALVWLLFYAVHPAIFREYARNKTYAFKLHIEHRN